VLRRSNEWLIATNLASLIVFLYLSAFIDLRAFIARFNVSHSQEISQEGPPLDIDYLSSLGPSAIPALDLYLLKLPTHLIDQRSQAVTVRYYLARNFEMRRRDWRSWTFRSARLDNYLLSPIAR
jgi:hypothetical protein